MRARVLALFSALPGSGGGIARFDADWLEALQGITQAVDIHALVRGATVNPRPAGLRAEQITAARGRVGYACAAWRMARRLRPALIHCAHLHLAPLAAWLARRLRCRWQLQVHGIEAWDPPSPLRRRAVDQADLICCVSRYTRQRLLQWARIAPERVRVLPNTVADSFQPDPSAVLSAPALPTQGGPRLLTVGRLSAAEAYKGHDRVIAALPAVLQSHPELQYLIAGTGDDQPRLAAAAIAAGVAAHVHFLGAVPPAQLPALYRSVDAYVMPSRGEGFGIVFLEALACGTPVIALAGDGSADPLVDGVLGTLATPETLGDAILHTLARPRDPLQLAAATRLRFGRAAYGQHLQRLLQPVLPVTHPA